MCKNEFMNTKVKIDLKKDGKVVNADELLRPKLKSHTVCQMQAIVYYWFSNFVLLFAIKLKCTLSVGGGYPMILNLHFLGLITLYGPLS